MDDKIVSAVVCQKRYRKLRTLEAIEKVATNLKFFFLTTIQLLLCLQTYFPDGIICHQNRMNKIQQKVGTNHCQRNKETTSFFNFFLELK